MAYLNTLNDRQRQAVRFGAGHGLPPTLFLAGAVIFNGIGAAGKLLGATMMSI